MAEPQNPIWVDLVIPVLTAVCGALAGFIIKEYQSSRRRRKELLAKQAALQFAYLDPLRIAAENFAWKLFTIEQKIRQQEPGKGDLEWMKGEFRCVAEPRAIPSWVEYGRWCNSNGFFAVSTIYAAAIYLLHARRARREYATDIELMRRLEAVRLALGHEHGIWIILQDSMGEYVGDEKGMEIGYRQFCAKLFNEQERSWFLNLLEYFRDIHLKTPEERRKGLVALRNLLTYLQQRTGVEAAVPVIE